MIRCERRTCIARRILLIAMLALCAATPTRAAAAEETAANIVHFEVAGFARNGAISVAYERLFGSIGGLRVGVGYASLGGFDGDGEGFGPYVMWDFLFGSGASKFELGLGVSLLFQGDRYDWCWIGRFDGICVDPQLSVAYRYQAVGGGFVFRVGLMWTLSYGMPFGIGVGYRF